MTQTLLTIKPYQQNILYLIPVVAFCIIFACLMIMKRRQQKINYETWTEDFLKQCPNHGLKITSLKDLNNKHYDEILESFNSGLTPAEAASEFNLQREQELEHN